jgi:hypothetical protein
VTADSEPLVISRGRGGQVEVVGRVDAFAVEILRKAGFLFEPSLRGTWIRLPFDLGRAWENEHAGWAAAMLIAARYPVRLDPSLTDTPPDRTVPPPPALGTPPSQHHR